MSYTYEKAKAPIGDFEQIEGVHVIRSDKSDRAVLGYQPTPTSVVAGNPLTVAQLMTGILHDDPEGAATWTLPTNTLLRAGWDNVQTGDCLDFFIINEATSAADEPITLAAGSGGSIVGDTSIEAKQVTGGINSGSSHWRLRIASDSAYVCYRLA